MAENSADIAKRIILNCVAEGMTVEQAIISQKFEGASSGFFNHNIIARDLGLMNLALKVFGLLKIRQDQQLQKVV